MIEEFYRERMRRFANEERRCSKHNSLYAGMRLIVIVGGIAGGIALYPHSAWLGAAAIVLMCVVFAILLKKHLAGMERQQQMQRMVDINRNESRCLAGDFTAYPAGGQYCDHGHDYSSDLDIFGEHSLFRFLNRTTSASGSDMLAAWLRTAATTDVIDARQQSVNELAPMVDFRQAMQAIGMKYSASGGELPSFLAWLGGGTVVMNRRVMLRVMQVLPWITVAAIAACVAGWLPPGMVWLLVCVHFLIYGGVLQTVNRLHQQVSRKVQFVSTYSEMIALVAGAGFTSPGLRLLKNRLHESRALQQISALQGCIRRLDYRLNMAFVPLNVLFFFDYKQLVWLERWRCGAGRQLPSWFEALAQIEALASFANARHNYPRSWTMPAVHDLYFALDARNVGHPLIAEGERVCNDFALDGAGRIAVVTGSNMAGKSTFERSIGVNMVLALAGAPVCAERFAISNCRLFTYMRVADSLEEHTSQFYAELKRLQQLIEITAAGVRVFFLLDEVLRGTNSRDRQTGSRALIRQLALRQVSGIISTHDLSLGELENELPDHVSNAHFDVQINGEDMAFDYKLYRGICTSLNASILMKKIGIDID